MFNTIKRFLKIRKPEKFNQDNVYIRQVLTEKVCKTYSFTFDQQGIIQGTGEFTVWSLFYEEKLFAKYITYKNSTTKDELIIDFNCKQFKDYKLMKFLENEKAIISYKYNPCYI